MPDWDDFDRIMDRGMNQLDKAMESVDKNLDTVFDKTNRMFNKRMRDVPKFKVDIEPEVFHMAEKLKLIGWAIKSSVFIFVIVIMILVWGMFSSYVTEKAHEPKALNPPAVEEVQPEEVKPQSGTMKKL